LVQGHCGAMLMARRGPRCNDQPVHGAVRINARPGLHPCRPAHRHPRAVEHLRPQIFTDPPSQEFGSVGAGMLPSGETTIGQLATSRLGFNFKEPMFLTGNCFSRRRFIVTATRVRENRLSRTPIQTARCQAGRCVSIGKSWRFGPVFGRFWPNAGDVGVRLRLGADHRLLS
jgi:hypothetical protein